MTDNIKPEHYRTGEIDLFESWYRTRPFNEFRAIMESIAERYMKRDKEDRIQDLNKAIYTMERLKEKEIERSGLSSNTKFEDDFETISKSVCGSKKIKIAGIYREKVHIRKISLLNQLQDNGNEYLARDKSDRLFAFEIKPQKNVDDWGAWHEDCEIIINDNFPEVQWTDNEPTKIADLLASYENGGENGK